MIEMAFVICTVLAIGTVHYLWIESKASNTEAVFLILPVIWAFYLILKFND